MTSAKAPALAHSALIDNYEYQANPECDIIYTPPETDDTGPSRTCCTRDRCECKSVDDGTRRDDNDSEASFIRWMDTYYIPHPTECLNVAIKYVGNSHKKAQVDRWCTRSSDQHTPADTPRQLGPLTLVAQVGMLGTDMDTLVDSGASKTFGNEDKFVAIAKRDNLPVERLENPLQVRVANGNTITARFIMRAVRIQIGTYICTMDVTLLPLGKLELVLGMPWLESTNPAICWRTKCLTVANNTGTHLFCSQGRDVRRVDDIDAMLPDQFASLDEVTDILVQGKDGEECFLLTCTRIDSPPIIEPEARLPIDDDHEVRVYTMENAEDSPLQRQPVDLHQLEALTRQAEATMRQGPQQRWLYELATATSNAIKGLPHDNLTAMDDHDRREPVTANIESVPSPNDDTPLEQFDRLFKAGTDGEQHLPPDVFKELRDVIQKSSKVFTAHDSLPEGQVFEGRPFRAVFRLRQDAPPPSYRRAKSVSPRELEYLREKIGLWMRRGFIRPCISEMTSPVVLVKKPGHTPEAPKLRLCVNYTAVNRRLEIVRFSPPRPRELFDELRGFKYYTVADMSDGFHSVRLDPASQEFTAMEISGLGTFCWTVLPMGTASSPGIFSWVVTQALRSVLFPNLVEFRDRRTPSSGIPVASDEDVKWALSQGAVRAYVDDVIIASNCVKSHFILFKEVLRLLELQGLRVGVDKLKPMRLSVVYLGYIISAKGIAPDPAKQQVISDWPLPTTKEHLHQWLGLTGYYRTLSKNFAHWSSILYPHVGLDAPDEVEWTPLMRKHFEEIKTELCSKILLSQPDPDKGYIVTADASKYAIGAALMQENKDGVRVPIAFTGRKFTPTELRYFPYEREALALYYACTQWINYLDMARSVLVETDHRSLADLLTQKKELDGRQSKWAEYLARFPIELRWIKGIENEAADAISRRPDWHPGDPPAFPFEPAAEIMYLGAHGWAAAGGTTSIHDGELSVTLLCLTEVHDKDQWVTAPHIANDLIRHFGPFTATACGRADGSDNVTGEGTETWTDAHTHEWAGHTALCNPPYSNIGPIVERYLQCKERRPEDTSALFILPMGDSHVRTEWFSQAMQHMTLVHVYPEGSDIFRLPRERFYGATDQEYINVGPCRWPVGIFWSPRGHVHVPHDQAADYLQGVRARIARQQHTLVFNALLQGSPAITATEALRDTTIIDDDVLSRAYEQFPVNAVTPLSDPMTTEGILHKILAAYESDPHALQIRRGDTVKWTGNPLPGEQWTSTDGLIYTTRPLMEFPVLYIPAGAREVHADLLEEFHDSRLGAHQGVQTTTANLERHVWWPSLRRDVQRHVETCTTCARIKAVRSARPGGEKYQPQLPGRPFEVVAIDSFDMPESAAGNNACWAMVCTLTRRGYLEPYKKKGDTGDKLAIRYIWTIYRNGFGLPRIIVSDLDSKLISHFWRRLWTNIGTTLKYVPKAAHHQNGRVERFVGTMRDLMRSTARDNMLYWDEDCAVYETAYNDTYRAGIPITPFQQTIGHHPVTPASLVFDAARRRMLGRSSSEGRGSGDPTTWLQRFQALVIKTKALLRKQLIARVQNETSGTTTPPVFERGDYVWVQDARAAEGSSKLPLMADRYTGPFKVLDRRHLNYDIDFGETSRRFNPIHVGLLKPYVSKTTGLPYPDKEDRILDQRYRP